ncbi:hypothetical protein HKX48_005921 [Thoreauomyces humboldtii]|nr:hypothetical protein HKX48_005921 [Thoreauomyces humboldtii]
MLRQLARARRKRRHVVVLRIREGDIVRFGRIIRGNGHGEGTVVNQEEVAVAVAELLAALNPGDSVDAVNDSVMELELVLEEGEVVASMIGKIAADIVTEAKSLSEGEIVTATVILEPPDVDEVSSVRDEVDVSSDLETEVGLLVGEEKAFKVSEVEASKMVTEKAVVVAVELVESEVYGEGVSSAEDEAADCQKVEADGLAVGVAVELANIVESEGPFDELEGVMKLDVVKSLYAEASAEDEAAEWEKVEGVVLTG